MPVVLIAAAVIIVFIFGSIKKVPPSQVWVVERMGQFCASWETGIHYAVPFLDRVVRKIDMREQLAEITMQTAETKDGQTVSIDAVVFFSVTDAEKFTYGIERPVESVRTLALTALHDIAGSMELEKLRSERRTVGAKLTDVLGGAVGIWGIRIEKAELKNITTR